MGIDKSQWKERSNRVSIKSIASHVSGPALSSDEMVEALNGRISDELKSSLLSTGVQTRHSVVSYYPDFLAGKKPRFLSDDTDSQAIQAIRLCLEKATNIDPQDIGLFIALTNTPNRLMPCFAYDLIAKLGSLVSHQMNVLNMQAQACSALLKAIDIAGYYLQANPKKYSLVVVSETTTSFIIESIRNSMHYGFSELKGRPETDRIATERLMSSFLFGDGAVAILLENNPNQPYMTRFVHLTDVDASDAEILRTNEGGILKPNYEGAAFYHLDRLVPKRGMYYSEQCLNELFTNPSPSFKTPKEAEVYLIHTGSKKILDGIAKLLGTTPEDPRLAISYDILTRYGNLSTASVGFMLESLFQKQANVPIQKGLIISFGAGFSATSALIQSETKTENDGIFKKSTIHEVKVEFEDLDAAQVVHHSRYLSYCERGRNEVLGRLQLSILEQFQKEAVFAVADIDSHYKRAIRSGLVFVVTRLVENNDKTILIRHALYQKKPEVILLEQDEIQKSDDCCFWADYRFVLVDPKAEKAISIPEEYRQKLGIDTPANTRVVQASSSLPTPTSFNFKDKVVLITGGTSGIGLAAVKAFAQNHAKVIFTGRRSELGQNIQSDLCAQGLLVEFMAADVCNCEEMDKVFSKIDQKYGPLDIAFNNAGNEGKIAPLLAWKEKDLDEVIRANLSSMFWCVKKELERMQTQKRGAIINNSSVFGLIGYPMSSGYIASKHGVIGLTKASAVEYADKGIRVNAIAPGTIHTEMIMRSTKNNPDVFKTGIPMKRLGNPEEAAGAVLWLASDMASYVTGQVISIDGGVSTLRNLG